MKEEKTMVLILDGNSEHVAHVARMKENMFFLKKKSDLWLISIKCLKQIK